MKLPTLQSSPAGFHSVAGPHVHYQVQQGIGPEGILDTIGSVVSGAVSKIPCVLSKAGPSALGCLFCGPNPACLALCAGPALVSSIMQCL